MPRHLVRVDRRERSRTTDAMLIDTGPWRTQTSPRTGSSGGWSRSWQPILSVTPAHGAGRVRHACRIRACARPPSTRSWPSTGPHRQADGRRGDRRVRLGGRRGRLRGRGAAGVAELRPACPPTGGSCSASASTSATSWSRARTCSATGSTSPRGWSSCASPVACSSPAPPTTSSRASSACRSSSPVSSGSRTSPGRCGPTGCGWTERPRGPARGSGGGFSCNCWRFAS